MTTRIGRSVGCSVWTVPRRTAYSAFSARFRLRSRNMQPESASATSRHRQNRERLSAVRRLFPGQDALAGAVAIAWPISSLRRRHARVPDVTMEPPLPTFPLPDDDVLAAVERLPALARRRIGPNLVGDVTAGCHLERGQLDGFDSRVHRALPELGDGLAAPGDLAVRRKGLARGGVV